MSPFGPFDDATSAGLQERLCELWATLRARVKVPPLSRNQQDRRGLAGSDRSKSSGAVVAVRDVRVEVWKRGLEKSGSKKQWALNRREPEVKV